MHAHQYVRVLARAHSHDQKVRQMLQTKASVPRGLARYTSGKNHALCTQDKPLHHFTSAVVGRADGPRPGSGFWPQLSDHLGIHQSLLWLAVQ